MKKLLFLIVWGLLASTVLAFPVCREGQPCTEIVLPENSHQTVQFAAKELQRWIGEITGAVLPIVKEADPTRPQIVLAVRPAQFSEDVKKLTGNDGYAVRQKDKTLYVIAGSPKGILNGVYKILHKNSDIIWARPDEKLGTIFTKKSDFDIADTGFIDIPVYVLRGFMMGRDKKIRLRTLDPVLVWRDAVWQARNGSNWDELPPRDPMKRELGSVLEYGSGHNLVRLFITEKKYYKDHPEYFPFREGHRMRPSEARLLTQLCFTNREMTEEFIRVLDQQVQENPEYDTYRIMIEDNYNTCECPECLKPVTLENGVTVTKEDPAFQSTRFFLFLNEIARFMQKKYPGKRILTAAYFFTEIPPACPVEPNIDISYCPIYKNSKYPIDAPENKKTFDKFQEWMKVTPNLTWREYYGLTREFPRPADSIALADLAFVNKYGVRRTYSEMYAELDGPEKKGVKIWDLNGMYYWVLAQAAWDPYRSAEELRDEYLTRVYGEAAPDVRAFYSIIEKGWLKSKTPSYWHSSIPAAWRDSLPDPDAKDACRAALDRAAGKPMHPQARLLLDALRRAFEEQMASTKEFGTTAVRTQEKPPFDPDFKEGPWAEALVIDRFYTSMRTAPQEKTEVRLLYDDQYLYVGVKCFLSAPQKPYSSPAGLPRGQWSNGEKFECQIQGADKKVYQIAVDYNGNIFAKINKTDFWDGDYRAEQKKTADGWSLMLSIPIKPLGFTGAPTDAGRIMFVRYWDNRTKGFGCWESGAVNDPVNFGTLNFL